MALGCTDARGPVGPRASPEPPEWQSGSGSPALDRAIVDFMCSVRYEDLPGDVVDYCKKTTLDQLACVIGGTSMHHCPQIFEWAKSLGGEPQATLLVSGGKVPAAVAAAVNGVAGRALDMGDCHSEAGHVWEYLMTPLLAAAELKQGATGKEYITAASVAGEISVRIGLAAHAISVGIGQRMVQPASGQITAAGGIAKLLGGNEDIIWNAMGIAYEASSGWGMGPNFEGNEMVSGQHYFASRSSLESALLAQLGVQGTKGVFGARWGLFGMQYNASQADLSYLTTRLGSRWYLPETSHKPYSSCAGTHAAITGAVSLAREHDIKYQDIAHVTLRGAAAHLLLVEPKKWNPRTMPEAQFSLPFCVASALVDGELYPDAYQEKKFFRPEVRDLMQKVTFSEDPKVRLGSETGIKITVRDGTEYETFVCYPYGHPRNPMTWDDVIAKLHKLADFSVRPIHGQKLEKLMDKCRQMEGLHDVTELCRLITS